MMITAISKRILKNFLILFTLGSLTVADCSARAGETTIVSGAISEDQQWSGDLVVSGEVTVESGAELRIAAGTTLRFQSDARLTVRGALLADGGEGRPIVWTRENDGETWDGVRFLHAADSRMRHCVVEYVDCEGDHKDYYDDDCDESTPLPPRDYFQAITLIGSRVEFEDCLFHKLPDDSSNAEGDAVAVISDDPESPGESSAVFRRCQFIGIGQGIHTRFAYVLVEDCYFTGHNGDNDDVDLYGESEPPPLIRNNLFLDPNHDDMINPTRCSAVIIGNVISGGDDHGIVLRDKCEPILIGNTIYNCDSAGIAVQNQCNALLINNTIVDCGRGVRFFDHTGRWGPPYCLFPGSGEAVLINNIIWDCPTPFELSDSPADGGSGSRARVFRSDIEGGLEAASVSSDSILEWDETNLEANPLFDEPVETELRLSAMSLLIDAGMDPYGLIQSLEHPFALDDVDTPGPLDGDGDGESKYDIGAHEYLLPAADSNRDGVPDGWYADYSLDPAIPGQAALDADEDRASNYDEWIADTNPVDPGSRFLLNVQFGDGGVDVKFNASAQRRYTLYSKSALSNGEWLEVPGRKNIEGHAGDLLFTDPIGDPSKFYRVKVELTDAPNGD